MQAELDTLYAPTLDPALIAAIASDVDTIEEAKETLDALYADAIATEQEEGVSIPDADALAIQELTLSDELTSTTDSLPTEEAEELSKDEDLKFLRLSFPLQNLVTLKFVLQKSGHDVLRAVDELLNRETLDREREFDAILDGSEAGGQAVDAFFDEGQQYSRQRKQQKRAKQAQGDKSLADVLVEERARPKLSKWEQISRDVDWLCRVTLMDRALAQSSYHRHPHLGAALDDLLGKAEARTTNSSFKHPDREANRLKLVKSFRALGQDKIDQLLDLTHDDLSLATEAAQVLASWRPFDPVITGKSDGSSTPAMSREEMIQSRLVAHNDTSTAMTAAEYRALANEHAQRRDAFYAQASKAHTENKASHRGVALHYAECGREQDVKMRMYTMKAARAQAQAGLRTVDGAVAAQFGNVSEVDLHGMTVQQAVDVAREQTVQWWTHVRLAEDAKTAQRSLRLVTGKGNHSAGGHARLYPAVKAMLEREGWRVDVGSGMLIVRGILRH